ncbi:MAG: Clp1/GlmU family protein [bacterium]
MSTIKLQNGEIYLIQGPVNIKVQTGEVEVVGARISDGNNMEIPRGKTIPVEALAKTKLIIEGLQDREPELLGKRSIPQSWDELVGEIEANRPSCVLVFGEMDTGKTFFSTYLTNRLLETFNGVAVMDCDLGQSDIGPPGTVGMTIFNEPAVALDTVDWDELAFVGAHSPGLHMVPFLSGIRRLADRALEQADIIIVDTTGWVQGDGGRTVKQGKIDMLNPDKIVLLQKEEELEHLVCTVGEERVKRVKVSDKVTPTPPSERKGLRERSMKNYLKDASLKTIDLEEFGLERTYFGSGRELDLEIPGILHAEKLSAWEGVLVVANGELSAEAREALSDYGQIRLIKPGGEKGVLIGFTSEHDVCLGLGVIESIDYKNKVMKVHTPLENPEEAFRIQFGSLRYKPNGNENGFIEPGML